MQITSRRKAFAFSICATAVAVACASVLESVLLDRPFAGGHWKSTVLIGGLVAFPMAYWVSMLLYKNHRLAEQLLRMLNRDHLTDLATRNSFFDRLGVGDPEGVALMIDIDHFKSVNDTYGHLVGDQVIQSVAARIKEQVRKRDIVGRFGGEEFIVFLFDADSTAGYTIAGAIRTSIADTSHVLAGGPPRVTVSVGGARKVKPSGVYDAIRSADGAMYQAKGLWRNRTAFAETEMAAARSEAF